jgi:alpha-L-fucosidase
VFEDELVRPAEYQHLERETPAWFRDAKLGIFLHWGPYAVPAWAEPADVSGNTGIASFMRHNPYAEWYFNTIRVPDSPAAQHHREVHGDAPYDDFLDQWTARDFGAASFLQLVAATGAGYFIPTSKHHDGVTLWDAPGTGDRNTVRRGPRRDLVAELAHATREAGLRFGVYYSGGFDWHAAPKPAITDDASFHDMPGDQAYADYAYDHVVDLISRYRPDVLWGDIGWPDAGKAPGPKSLLQLFEQFYEAVPDGVVNDRWGETHWDFRTSEYHHGRAVEGAGVWEHTRGIGYSFGYNSLEDERHSLSGPEAVKQLVDVVSRGGNLLLNVGLTADGSVPPVQRRTLEALGTWNSVNGGALLGSEVADPGLASPTDDPWVRWTRNGGTLHAFVCAPAGPVALTFEASRVDAASGRRLDGSPAQVAPGGSGAEVVLLEDADAPIVIAFDLR